MHRIIFVCHGNICRSPMAEFVFKNMVAKEGLSEEFVINSAATSTEEIGSGVHRGTRAKLASVGITDCDHRAVQLVRADYERYDLIIGMDSANIAWISRIVGEDTDKKIYRLLDFTDAPRDIADPWYTGDFDVTYDDVLRGCRALLSHLNKV